MAVLGLRFCARAFSSCGERGPLFIAVHGPLTVVASPVAEHKLRTRKLSSCGSRAWLLRGMWDLPRPGLEPVSPALAGRFLTTAPPGKPCEVHFVWYWCGLSSFLIVSDCLVYLSSPFYFFFLKINLFILFIYFWLHGVFVAMCGLSVVVASGVYSLLRCVGFSLQWLLLLWSTGSRRGGFSSCDTWAQ